MGMAASQARYLALVARKSNCEYEGQQINQQRTTLANQSANLFNQMLGLSVPVPPSTSDYTTTQYSYTDGTNNSVITKWEQLSTADPDYNYVVTHSYDVDRYTGAVKKMSDPQVQVTSGTTSSTQQNDIFTSYSAMIQAKEALAAAEQANVTAQANVTKVEEDLQQNDPIISAQYTAWQNVVAQITTANQTLTSAQALEALNLTTLTTLQANYTTNLDAASGGTWDKTAVNKALSDDANLIDQKKNYSDIATTLENQNNTLQTGLTTINLQATTDINNAFGVGGSIEQITTNLTNLAKDVGTMTGSTYNDIRQAVDAHKEITNYSNQAKSDYYNNTSGITSISKSGNTYICTDSSTPPNVIATLSEYDGNDPVTNDSLQKLATSMGYTGGNYITQLENLYGKIYVNTASGTQDIIFEGLNGTDDTQKGTLKYKIANPTTDLKVYADSGYTDTSTSYSIDSIANAFSTADTNYNLSTMNTYLDSVAEDVSELQTKIGELSSTSTASEVEAAINKAIEIYNGIKDIESKVVTTRSTTGNSVVDSFLGQYDNQASNYKTALGSHNTNVSTALEQLRTLSDNFTKISVTDADVSGSYASTVANASTTLTTLINDLNGTDLSDAISKVKSTSGTSGITNAQTMVNAIDDTTTPLQPTTAYTQQQIDGLADMTSAVSDIVTVVQDLGTSTDALYNLTTTNPTGYAADIASDIGSNYLNLLGGHSVIGKYTAGSSPSFADTTTTTYSVATSYSALPTDNKIQTLIGNLSDAEQQAIQHGDTYVIYCNDSYNPGEYNVIFMDKSSATDSAYNSYKSYSTYDSTNKTQTLSKTAESIGSTGKDLAFEFSNTPTSARVITTNSSGDVVDQYDNEFTTNAGSPFSNTSGLPQIVTDYLTAHKEDEVVADFLATGSSKGLIYRLIPEGSTPSTAAACEVVILDDNTSPIPTTPTTVTGNNPQGYSAVATSLKTSTQHVNDVIDVASDLVQAQESYDASVTARITAQNDVNTLQPQETAAEQAYQNALNANTEYTQAVADAALAQTTLTLAETDYNNKLRAYEALAHPTYVGNCELTPLADDPQSYTDPGTGQTYTIYSLTDDQKTELKQIVKDMQANGYDVNINDCFDSAGNYIGGIYSFTWNNQTYYTTYEDLMDAYPATQGNNYIDEQVKLSYYNAGYVSTKVEETEKALLETDGQGRFSSVRFESDSTVYTLNTETTTDDEAYNDAMNQYYYENAKYDKMVQDINAKTSIIQQEDLQLELRLKQLDTEQNALSTEMDAVKKVIENNVKDSFKTFSG